MYDICCIGHITLDKVVNPKSTVYMPGGTAFYFSTALSSFPVRYLLVTALGRRDLDLLDPLKQKGIELMALPSAHTVHFENIYADNPDHRRQRVLQTADPFLPEQLEKVKARIFHIGPLLANDMSLELIRQLSAKGLVSLDVQGFLRKVENRKVIPVDWPFKRQALPLIHTLKANESEMFVLTGEQSPQKAARILYDWGVKEVVLTLGSSGSLLFDGHRFYDIPAYQPNTFVVDATGCGDTYMAGYLGRRARGADMESAGEFAAAMATLKIESSGPFNGTEQDALNLLADSRRRVRFAG